MILKQIAVVLTLLLTPCSGWPQKQQESKYTITKFEHISNTYIYTIEFGNAVLKVEYKESQTTSAKPGDFPGTGLHLHLAVSDPDLSQIPAAGVPMSACILQRDFHGDLIVARQPTNNPCMARIGDSLVYEPSPNGPELFTYVRFDILSEKIRRRTK